MRISLQNDEILYCKNQPLNCNGMKVPKEFENIPQEWFRNIT
jgi:hypothetical protein